MISPLYAANNLIRRANEQAINLTSLKLQKLLYLLYTMYLYNTDESLFPDRFEAWQYGPVLTDIYNIFKIEGSNPITEMRPDGNGRILIVSEKGIFGDIFDNVWTKYARESAFFLVTLTHGESNSSYKTAWRKAVDRYKGEFGAFLEDDDIKKDGEFWFGKRSN